MVRARTTPLRTRTPHGRRGSHRHGGRRPRARRRHQHPADGGPAFLHGVASGGLKVTGRFGRHLEAGRDLRDDLAGSSSGRSRPIGRDRRPDCWGCRLPTTWTTSCGSPRRRSRWPRPPRSRRRTGTCSGSTWTRTATASSTSPPNARGRPSTWSATRPARTRPRPGPLVPHTQRHPEGRAGRRPGALTGGTGPRTRCAAPYAPQSVARKPRATFQVRSAAALSKSGRSGSVYRCPAPG